jgi:hypothetical protein
VQQNQQQLQQEQQRQPAAGLLDGTTPAAAAFDSALALNARDFGARGDGASDDTAALQRAIDAAQSLGRALAIPAGLYSISSTLFIRWTEDDDCSEPTCPGTHHPLRMFGESMYATAIVANATNFSCVAAGTFGCSVLSLPGRQQEGIDPWVENFGKTTTDHEISHISFDANYRARYCVYAPMITRSRLVAVEGSHATAAGIMFGNGWCNYLLQCRLWENTIGILLVNAVNNVNVINAIIEDNAGPGIVAVGGYQINLEGNTVESCGGPGIVASSVFALNIQSNYFEDNNAGTNRPNSSHYNISFADPEQVIEVPSDIALGVALVDLWWTRETLNPSTCIHAYTLKSNPSLIAQCAVAAGGAGGADPIHDSLSNMTFTKGGVCEGVVVSANHFSTGGDRKSAVLLAAAKGVRLTANTCYWDNEPSEVNQCALVTAGGNCSRFYAEDISWDANVPSYYYLKDGRHAVRMAGFSKWVDIIDPSVGSGTFLGLPYVGEACNSFHTYSGQEVVQRNYVRPCLSEHGQTTWWDCKYDQVATPRFPRHPAGAVSMVPAAGVEWDAHPVYNWTLDAVSSSVLLLSLDLATTPSLAGQPVYMALTARVPSDVFLTLAIDAGDGVFRYSDDGTTTTTPTAARAGAAATATVWQLRSYQGILMNNGTARFAAFCWRHSVGAGGAAVQLSGPVAVAAVGTAFSGAAVSS